MTATQSAAWDSQRAKQRIKHQRDRETECHQRANLGQQRRDGLPAQLGAALEPDRQQKIYGQGFIQRFGQAQVGLADLGDDAEDEKPDYNVYHCSLRVQDFRIETESKPNTGSAGSGRHSLLLYLRL
jgi:hypothetical protein